MVLLDRFFSDYKKKYLFVKNACKMFKKTILNEKQPLLKRLNANIVVMTLTILLQFVSIFTTYAGVRYYFSGINLLAPYAVTVVIQLSIIYLCNTLSNYNTKIFIFLHLFFRYYLFLFEPIIFD